MNRTKNFRTCAVPVRLTVLQPSIRRSPHDHPEPIIHFLARMLLSPLIVFVQNRITLIVSEAKDALNKNSYGHVAGHPDRCIYDNVDAGEGNKRIPNKDIRLDGLEALKKLRAPVLPWPLVYDDAPNVSLTGNRYTV